MEFQLYATCPDEVTELLAKEIESIGGTNIRTAYRVVYFDASEEVYYKAHLHLRTASRIYRILKSIPAQSPTIVFDKAKKIRFFELFSEKHPVTVEVVASNREGKIPCHLIGSKLREAINDSFQHNLKVTPNASSRDAVVGIAGFFHDNRLTVSIDTSLNSLHKRGFRIDGHPAPLKESLAAALLAVCEYKGTTDFFDPMCGSGTIVIEAAHIAMNRAPLMLRKKGEFGFEYLNDFNPELWHTIQERAREAEISPRVGLFASDIEPEFVNLAKRTAMNCQIEKYIQFNTKDFFKIEKPSDCGTMIVNVPYGVRMADQNVSADFLRAIGDHLKSNFKGWRCGILAPLSAPLKAIGLKPNKQAKFLNGTVPVKLLVFDIY